MLNGRKLYFFLLIYFIILLIPAYWLPLFETTDARYAEISREMLATGNFLEPLYNGIKHFHKPPLTYWINALGLYIFGINGFGARFFGSVAAVLTLIYTRKTAVVLTDDEETADRTVLILSGSILFLIVSRIVSTDIYLEFFTIAALYYMFRQTYGAKSRYNALMTGVHLGLGFLTKGPVIFLFTLLPFVTALFFSREHRRAFGLKDFLLGLAVFLVISLPWYIYVVIAEPGLLRYFLVVQTVDRVATNKFERSKPIYFFFMVFFGTFIPWIFYFLRNWKFADKMKTGKILYLYILMPFIVFELSTSKLGTYILPFYPAAALIAALNMDSKWLERLSAAILLLLGIAAAVAPFVKDFVHPYANILVPFGIFYFLLSVWVIFGKRLTVRSFTYMVLLFTLAAYCFVPLIGPYVKGYRMQCDDIKKFDPTGRYNVLIYRTFLPVISFYLNDVKPIAFARERETQFQTEEDYKRYLIESDEDLNAYLKKNPELILISRYDTDKEFEERTGYTCTLISVRGGDKKAFFCKAP